MLMSDIAIGYSAWYRKQPRKTSGGKVIGWEVGWGEQRLFATDMAGFAVNVAFFNQHPGIK